MCDQVLDFPFERSTTTTQEEQGQGQGLEQGLFVRLWWGGGKFKPHTNQLTHSIVHQVEG